MKNKKVVQTFVFAILLPVLGGWTKNDAIDPNMIITDTTVDPIVRYGEQGEVLKLNDPEDPKNSTLSSLSVKNKIMPLFFNTDTKVSESEAIELEYSPYNASLNGLIYETSNAKVATVSSDGVVTSKGPGVCEITVKNFDGSISSKCHVVVNDSDEVPSAAQNRKNAIVKAQGEPDFTAGDSIYLDEIYSSIRYEGEGNDKPISGTIFREKIWCSQEKAYFRIVETEQEQKVEGGSYEPSRADYIFYTTDDYYTYIFKTDGNIRNYMRLDQSNLVTEGKTKFDALSQAIGNFFTAGSEIITRQFEDVKGEDITSKKSIWGNLDTFGCFSSLDDKTELQIKYIDISNYQVGDDQEDSFKIPARTPFTVTDDTRVLWEDNLVTAKIIDEKWEWTLDGVDYRDENKVAYYYEHENVELYKPSLSDYAKVDSIFDL